MFHIWGLVRKIDSGIPFLVIPSLNFSPATAPVLFILELKPWRLQSAETGLLPFCGVQGQAVLEISKEWNPWNLSFPHAERERDCCDSPSIHPSSLCAAYSLDWNHTGSPLNKYRRKTQPFAPVHVFWGKRLLHSVLFFNVRPLESVCIHRHVGKQVYALNSMPVIVPTNAGSLCLWQSKNDIFFLPMKVFSFLLHVPQDRGDK